MTTQNDLFLSMIIDIFARFKSFERPLDVNVNFSDIAYLMSVVNTTKSQCQCHP